MRRVSVMAVVLTSHALLTLSFFLLAKLVACHYVDEFDNVLLCRQCGHEVAKASDFVTVSTSQALHQRNDTILGKENVLIQLLKNPQGRHFEIITTSSADVTKQPKLYKEHTWFDGFGWKIISCPQCRTHLGWYFEPKESKKAQMCQDETETKEGVCDEDTDTNENKEKKEEKKPFHALILTYLIHEEYAESLVVQPKFYGG